MRVDVLVAGGGPIGLAAAIEARLAGLTVAVIEPRDDAIDKACGEGLMPGALPLLQRLGVDPGGMPLRGVSYQNGTRRADHYFRTGPGRGVRRTTLQAALGARADALGVQRIVGRVDSVSHDADEVVAGDISAGWLFACDGLNSGIRKLVGLERTVSRPGRRYGLRQHFAIQPWSDLIEVHWTPKAEVYVTPVSPTEVGVAVLGPRGTDFVSTVARVPALAALRGAEPASTVRGAGPFQQRAARPSNGRVLLIGDASGYVDAITGEGLRLGFEQAAVAVAAVLGGPSYDRQWRRVTRDFRVLTSGLVRAAMSPFRGAIVPTAAALPSLYGSVVERLSR